MPRFLHTPFLHELLSWSWDNVLFTTRVKFLLTLTSFRCFLYFAIISTRIHIREIQEDTPQASTCELELGFDFWMSDCLISCISIWTILLNQKSVDCHEVYLRHGAERQISQAVFMFTIENWVAGDAYPQPRSAQRGQMMLNHQKHRPVWQIF